MHEHTRVVDEADTPLRIWIMCVIRRRNSGVLLAVVAGAAVKEVVVAVVVAVVEADTLLRIRIPKRAFSPVIDLLESLDAARAIRDHATRIPKRTHRLRKRANR